MRTEAVRALSGEDGFENTCDMVTNESVPPFSEIFNTYGEHLSNAQLLVRYGFLLDDNENDTISWNAQGLYHFAENFLTCPVSDNKYDTRPTCKDHSQFSDLCGVSETMIRTDSCGRQILHASYVKGLLRLAGNDIGEDQASKINFIETLLDRLWAVLDQWICGHSSWADSNLVYFPNDQEVAPRADSHGESTRPRNRTIHMSEANLNKTDRSISLGCDVSTSNNPEGSPAHVSTMSICQLAFPFYDFESI